ncbi:protein of unknown function [Thauera humireducens]|nr:protein of unknown function [Thauera humireducens]
MRSTNAWRRMCSRASGGSLRASILSMPELYQNLFDCRVNSWKPVKLGIRSAFRVPLIDGRLIDTLARVEGEVRCFVLGT